MFVDQLTKDERTEVCSHYKNEFKDKIRSLEEAFGNCIKQGDDLAFVFLVDVIQTMIAYTTQLMVKEDDDGMGLPKNADGFKLH